MSRVRPLLAVAVGVTSSLALALAQSPVPQPGHPLTGPGGEQLVHVFDEPRHKTVFQEGSVRVLDIQIPPGDTTLYHTHTTPIVYVNIARSTTRSQTLGKDWSGGDAPARPAAPAPDPRPSGDRTPPRAMSSIPGYAKEPVTHRVNNVGTSTFRLIGISNGSAGGATASDETPALTGEREVMNDYFRGYRHSLAAGASVASHAHKVPVVVVQVDEGQLKADGTKGRLTGPGSLVYVAPGQAHAIGNAGSGEVTVVEVEVRQPAK